MIIKETIMNEQNGENCSEVYITRNKENIGPNIGIVGLVHGDEKAGRAILDELKKVNLLKGTLTLIYANLPAEKADKRCIEANLNRVFPGKNEGKLEEIIAYHLMPHISFSNIVIDLHELYDNTPAFVITHNDEPRFYKLAQKTGLDHYARTGLNTKNGALIDFVNNYGGMGITIECGKYRTKSSIDTGLQSVKSVLASYGMIEAPILCSQPKKYRTEEMILVPENSTFVSYENVRNFELLQSSTPIGLLNGKEIRSPGYDCYPIFYNGGRIVDGKMLFAATKKIE